MFLDDPTATNVEVASSTLALHVKAATLFERASYLGVQWKSGMVNHTQRRMILTYIRPNRLGRTYTGLDCRSRLTSIHKRVFFLRELIRYAYRYGPQATCYIHDCASGHDPASQRFCRKQCSVKSEVSRGRQSSRYRDRKHS
jgi:hypothetical protein